MHVIELRLVLRLLGHSYLVHGHIQLNPCGAQLIVSEAQAMLLIIGYFCDKQLGGVSSHWPSFRKLFFLLFTNSLMVCPWQHIYGIACVRN